MLIRSLDLVTAPTVEPFTLAAMKRQVRLGSTAGEPAPTIPTVALAATPAAGNVDDGDHRYRYTFVTADGETEGGIISDVVTVADKAVNGQVEHTAIPLGGNAVTSRKVYRTKAGGSTYFLQSTIADNTTTTLTDNTADSGLGAAAPSTNTTEDPELTRWRAAARDRCELATGRALLTQTWELVLDAFPAASCIELPKPPLQSVTSITYSDTAGDSQTLAASEYVVTTPAGPRAARGRIGLAFGSQWPSTRGEIGDVVIRFVCGYGDAAANVPELLVSAMLLDGGTLYENREGAGYSNWSAVTLPGGVKDIYWSFRSHPPYRGAA